MKLTSSAFEPDQLIPVKYSKKGDNISPALSWENVPKETKSLALAIIDRHPVAKNFIHWLIIDIAPNITNLTEGASIPEGAKELKPYYGPNPPSGSHDYEFILYALKRDKLDVPSKVTREVFFEAVKKNCIATASMIGKFARGSSA
jgi:Raf kinase inhibitor-like YbhB/YbcL family protein